MKAMKKNPVVKKTRRKWLLAAGVGFVVICGLAYLVFSEPSAPSVQRRFASSLANTDGGFRDVTVRSNQVGPVHQFEFTATVSDGAAAYVLRCDKGVRDDPSSSPIRAHHAATYNAEAPGRILGLTVDTNGDKITLWQNGNTATPSEVRFLTPKAIQMAHAIRTSLGW
jgi:hypothetical protein